MTICYFIKKSAVPPDESCGGVFIDDIDKDKLLTEYAILFCTVESFY